MRSHANSHSRSASSPLPSAQYNAASAALASAFPAARRLTFRNSSRAAGRFPNCANASAAFDAANGVSIRAALVVGGGVDPCSPGARGGVEVGVPRTPKIPQSCRQHVPARVEYVRIRGKPPARRRLQGGVVISQRGGPISRALSCERSAGGRRATLGTSAGSVRRMASSYARVAASKSRALDAA